MKKVSLIFIYFSIELCCSYCFYEKIHNNHKVLSIDDEENLQKENITIENSAKEFNNNIQKIITLKGTIEKEILELDKLYEKVNSETTKSYKLKHEKLIKEENEIKEKLQNEVTKVKEQLKNCLSKSNELIKISERINKGIKNLEKEEKNMIKTLSYVSKINKNQKKMKILFKELMKNLKLTFDEKESNIKYEEYYFNGIQTPKDIEIKDISSNNFKIFWKIDEINLLNVDNKQIKFKVEIRKENENEKFVQIYNGSENNWTASNLDKTTSYEIRICSAYNELISNWSEIKKVKTNGLDSIILRESKKENIFLEQILEWSGYKSIELIYRGTRDGTTSNVFHQKYDNQGPTICLYKNEKGFIFGGYNSDSWNKDRNNYSNAPGSFLFTLTNSYDIGPTKFKNINSNSVYYHPSYGATFGGGHDIYISTDFSKSNAYSNLGSSYQDIIGKGRFIFTGELNNNNSNFKIKEIEVFKLFK